MTKSYTFYGSIDSSYDKWVQWIHSAELICNSLGYKANFYSINTKDKKTYNFKKAKSVLNKINSFAKKEEKIVNITVYVLPESYTTIIFDFIITLSRSIFEQINYVTLIANNNYPIVYNDDLIIKNLENNIIAKSCEIYEMDIEECPEMYAYKLVDCVKFKSLKVIKKFKISNDSLT